MQRPSPATLLPVTAIGVSIALALWAGLPRLGGDPAFQIGVAFTLVATFGLIWCFGARYADVGWMVVVATLLALKAWARPETLSSGDASYMFGVLELAMMLGFVGFLLSFFCVPLGPGRLELAFTVTLAIYWAVLYPLPRDIQIELGLMQAVPRYIGAVLLGYAGMHGVTTMKQLLPKRRKLVGAGALAAFVAAACYIVSARWISGMAHPLATPILDHAFAVALGVLLVADLVTFHREYVKAKSGRVTRNDSELVDETRRELGRGARALLLGRAHSGDYEDFHFEWHHRCESGVVWHDVWNVHGEMRLLFGDVSASGAMAPVAAMTVLCLLSEAKTRAMSIVEAAQFINKRLLVLFGRQVQVSFAAVSLGNDGSVEIFNAGEPGFFHVSRDGGRQRALSATPLGAVSDIEIAHEAVPLDDGDVLFLAGRSLLPDGAGPRRILAFFDDKLDFQPTVKTVREEVLRLAGAPALQDQILLLIERRIAVPTLLKQPG